MKPLFKRPIYLILSALIANGIAPTSLLAEPVYHPSGPKLTFGGMTHRQMTVSDMGNPAHPAGIPYPKGDTGLYSAGVSIGLGIEYNGNDNLFKLLEKASDSGATSPGGDGDSGGGEDADNPLPILPPGESLSPEQQAKLDALIREMAISAAFIGVAVTGLEAKVFVSADAPILISSNKLGAWTFGANVSLTTKIQGLNDPINFNADTAIASLKNAYATDPITTVDTSSKTYDLTGGASVTVKPDGSTKFKFVNDSGVITKAAQITEISIGYSRNVWQKDDNKFQLGIRPKYLDVGLSNAEVPLANSDNVKDVFGLLDKSSFSYRQDFAVDIGAIWSGKQYQVGATLTNLNEPAFVYPGKDPASLGFTNPNIIQSIIDSRTYVMKRQLKLDGGYITPGGSWGINLGLDINAVPDPMGDDYQWASIGVGFASDSWWLPGARLGIRKNMAGTELTYMTGGVTVFNIVNLDIASTTQTVNINGQTVPRGLIANIGFQILF